MDSQVPHTREVRRRMLLGLMSSPMTLAPLLAGITACLGAWALDIRMDLGVLAGVAGVLASVGMFFTQAVVGGEGRALRTIKKMQEESCAAREDMLDKLEERLTDDGDPRTESALRDLRTLARAFAELGAETSPELATLAVIDIRLDADELFDQCVRSLERSLRLWHTAQDMETPAARAPIHEQRERLLADVFESIGHMGKLLVSLQELGSGEGSVRALTRIREELDQNLAVAKRVDERLRDFDRELKGPLAE